MEGLDSGAAVQYLGDAFADLTGDPVLLTINMVAAGDITPPVFSGVTAGAVISSTSISLGWNAATDNVTSSGNMVYLIYKSSAAGGENFSSPDYSTPAGATTYVVTGLTPGSTYYFVVRAKDEAGNIDGNMIEKSKTLPDAVPPAFAGLVSATVLSSSSVLLSWSPATDDLSAQANIVYLIYQAASPSGETYTAPTYTTSPGATSYTVTGLMPGTTYYFVARAMDEAGNIDGNTIERSNTTPDTIPPAFAGLVSAATLTETSVQLSWSPASDNVTPQASIAYLVYQATTAGGEAFATPTYTSSPGAAGYAVSGLSQGTPYFFVVRARDGAGNIDGNSIEQSVTLADTKPPVFAGLDTISNVTGTTAQINWLPATDNVSSSANVVYLIYQASSSGTENFAAPSYTSLAGATSYTVTGLTPATQYFFVVRAKDEAGNIDGNTLEQSSTQPDSIPPSFAGISSVANASIKSMVLSWPTATDNVTPSGSISYYISQGTSTSGALSSPTFTALVSGNTFTAIGLIPGDTYYYHVRALDLAGNYDTNANVLANTYPGRYVTLTGSDANPCTKTLPCANISAAQALTGINEGIFVAAGSYSLPMMTLTNGNSLSCTGANHTTILSVAPTSGPIITGNQGSIIDGCQIIATNTAFPLITDGGADITVNNCMLKGLTSSSSTGIALLGNSAVLNSTLANFTFSVGSGFAISVTGGSALISNNTITANDNGISVTGGNPTITGNSISSNVGVGGSGAVISVSTSTVVLSGNTFKSNSNGITISGGIVSVSSNTISGNISTGISLPIGGASPTVSISSNWIDNNNPGISCQGKVEMSYC